MRWLDGITDEPGQTLGNGEEQTGLVCCTPWSRKESDMTGRLNNNNNEACFLVDILSLPGTQEPPGTHMAFLFLSYVAYFTELAVNFLLSFYTGHEEKVGSCRHV